MRQSNTSFAALIAGSWPPLPGLAMVCMALTTAWLTVMGFIIVVAALSRYIILLSILPLKQLLIISSIPSSGRRRSSYPFKRLSDFHKVTIAITLEALPVYHIVVSQYAA
jgi:hypothetical protein